MGRNYWLSLSFANLIYLRAWTDLVPLQASDLYFRKTVPGYGLYLGVVGGVLALSLAIFAVVSLAPRLPERLRQLLPVAAVALAALGAGFARTRLAEHAPAAIWVPDVVFVAAAVLAYRYSSQAARLMQAVAKAALPCLAVTFVAPLFYLHAALPLPKDPPLAKRLSGTPAVRVLWIIFDDWDQRLTFPDRAPGTPLPALDDLAHRSFAASRALAAEAGKPVKEMATSTAVPSLLYGVHASGSLADHPGTFIVPGGIGDFVGGGEFVAGEPMKFGKGNSIFARVRAQGWNAAAVGWYLPYCRAFARVLTDCYWDERYTQANSAGSTPLRAAVDETRMLFENDQYSVFGDSLVGMRHFAEYRALLAAARRYAADPSIGVAFIHLNVPHPPFFYNPEIGHSGRRGHPDDLYRDALRWVDRSVAEIVAAVGGAGLDSKTAVILSSDHPARMLRKVDPHVPFIVHLPGEEAGVVCDREFSAVRTADLAMAIARGAVHSPGEVEGFLVNDAERD